jgi:hypothetical protein
MDRLRLLKDEAGLSDSVQTEAEFGSRKPNSVSTTYFVSMRACNFAASFRNLRTVSSSMERPTAGHRGLCDRRTSGKPNTLEEKESALTAGQ